MGLLILFALLALFTSFCCSIMEAVILSASESWAEMKSNEIKNKKSATRLLNLKSNIDRPLSAILTLNTIANTVGAAGVGAQATKVFGNAYFGLVSAILTFLILFFAEIIPKTIGAIYWQKLAFITAKIISIIIIIVFPFVLVAERISKLISKNKKIIKISREEIAVLTNMGTREGIFKESENIIINNLIKLKSIKVKSILTPRTVLAIADENMPIKNFTSNKELLQYSRIPVYSGSQDNITGYVLKYNVFENLASGNTNIKMSQLKRPIPISYENFSVSAIFEMFLEKKEHISLVVNEYGDIEGVVSMEDIIETLLGLEITDEMDHNTDLQEFAKEKWKIRAKKLNILVDDNEKQKEQKSKEADNDTNNQGEIENTL